MAAYFFDTSALVKRYVEESGSRTVVDICKDDSVTVVIADISRAEFVSAISRRRRDGSVSQDQHRLLKTAFAVHLLREYLLAALEPAHVTAACELIERHALRAYDAIQLAVATSVRQKLLGSADKSFTFVSADGDLAAAARVEGLSVIEPSAA